MTTSPSSELEVNPLLKEDAFQNEQSRSLFEAIDELRNCGASRDIELPELVIVGDQSAGKSSLLQSLTDIPFPVASRLCTRFPTRIVSRRTAHASESTKVSIESKVFSAFRDDTLQETRTNYEGFTQDITKLSGEKFKEILERATHIMGIKRLAQSKDDATQEEQQGYRNFSDDVLKVEISGPDRSHFSILDVPGVFQSLTKDLTEKEKGGVRQMVEGYMASAQSVIICVASGTSDPATQAVFDMVSEFDENGERTVGVITKCDISQDITQVIDLAMNKEKTFRHGWFVVRNKTPEEVERGSSALDRFEKEQAFFAVQPWNQLAEERRGTQGLKEYLARLLCQRIEVAFPKLLQEIDNLRSSTLAKLEAMGDARATTTQKRSYLTKIAQEYEKLASQSLLGRYESVTANEMKLRKKIREFNEAFALDIRENGHSVPFVKQTEGSNADKGIKDHAELVTREDGKDQQSNFLNVGPPSSNGANALLFEPLKFAWKNETEIAHSIPYVEPYKKWSFEELRLSYYTQTPLFPTPDRGGGFGSGGIGSSPRPKQAQSSGSRDPVFGGGFGGGFGTSQTLTPTKSRGGASGASSVKQNGYSNNSTFNQGHDATPYRSKVSAQDDSRAVSKDIPQHSLKPELYKWIEEEIQNNKGTELQGTLNPDVLPAVFHRQACKWRKISEHHFSAVRAAVTKACREILRSVCYEALSLRRIENAIRNANRENQEQRLSELRDHVDKLLSSHIQTSNPVFNLRVSEARRSRFDAALARYKSSKMGGYGQAFNNDTDEDSDDTGSQHWLVVDMRDTAFLFSVLHSSNAQNLEDEVHDTLEAYYDVAKEDFIEYVNKHIFERYLDDKQGSVHFFSPTYVSELSDEEIHYLAAEDENLVRDRTVAQEALSRLDRAKEIAERHSI